MIQINVNADQEETGGKIFLDDPFLSNIYCPLFGGPEHKLNYSEKSCLQRVTQRLNKCKEYGCERHPGKPLVVQRS